MLEAALARGLGADQRPAAEVACESREDHYRLSAIWPQSESDPSAIAPQRRARPAHRCRMPLRVRSVAADSGRARKNHQPLLAIPDKDPSAMRSAAGHRVVTRKGAGPPPLHIAERRCLELGAKVADRAGPMQPTPPTAASL